MELGNFSVSLSVNDIDASRAFYEALGFSVFLDQTDQGWLILKQKGCIIGLFQGMFEGNILTFNPGWDENAQPVASFTDIRAIQTALRTAGIAIDTPVERESGPARLMVTDPDGNRILIDQHV